MYKPLIQYETDVVGGFVFHHNIIHTIFYSYTKIPFHR